MKKILSILLAVLMICTSCTCAMTAFAEGVEATECKNHDLKSTKYTYTSDPAAPELEVQYTKTYVCWNEGCTPESTTGSAGSTDRCPRCHERALNSKNIFYATCISGGYTVYDCRYCEELDAASNPFTEITEGVRAHNYDRKEVTAPKCESMGFTTEYCNCTKYGASSDASRVVDYIAAKGHNLNAANGVYTYSYTGKVCTVSGVCGDCGKSATEIKENATAEICGKCKISKIKGKTITIPASCSDTAEIKITCPTATCGTYTIKSLAVGHEAVHTTYTYNAESGKTTVKVNCAKCKGEETVVDTTDSTSCIRCGSFIEKRIVHEPSCVAAGYTQVVCSNSACGTYTETAKPTVTHKPTYSEWFFDRETGTYKFYANCSRYICNESDCTEGDCTPVRCNGYTNERAIGILGKCDNCGEDKLIYRKMIYADCVAGAVTIVKCTECCNRKADGDYEPITLYEGSSVAHNTITDDVKATCTTEGSRTTTCKKCYYTTFTDMTPALGHTGGVSSIEYTGGKKIVNGECERCVDLAGNPTAYSEVYNTYPTSETYCPVCKGNNIIKKIIIDPICAQPVNNVEKSINGYTRLVCSNSSCNNNNDMITDIVVATHSFGSWEIVKNATCSEDGIKAKTCASCGYVHLDSIPANKTESGDPKHIFYILEPGYPATCTEDGLSDNKYCTSCGLFVNAEVIPAIGHKTDPTSTNVDFCSRCNKYVIDADKEGTVKVPVKDANGNPVYEIEGYMVVVDENGNTVYETDENGNLVRDEDGELIPLYQKDQYGQRIPIYKYDKNGNKVPLYKNVACGCMCHNDDGLAIFFFNFILFFCRIFGINQSCDCGKIHF